MPSDPLILGFDTSAAHCAAALLCGDRILASAQEEMKRGQAERLFPLLEGVLAEAGVAWSDLSAIGVGIGPGNFTGIRLSVSAARGLALARAIPAVGVSSLDALAHGANGPTLTCLAAPRDHAYIAGHRMAKAIAPSLVSIADIPASLAEPDLTCIGSASAPVAAALGAAEAAPAYPTAEAIARIAAGRWQDTPDRPAPLYLKPADAAPARDSAPVIL
ncbi:tRNA (adenosine(37)-N6)-threonylcarbamoyltransferase complex dimerization subunit type 1 TsaB [Shimia aestuarii]|uniref:tRNA (adenosine(37)-N6)-threonylcarbamoyltransferase complex dimerization subunit type 1 TsaB n=1 Tax=Shimia aestuarii TaxID=254406 RepID=UPI001FB3954C|nr:tRNA (adenosine(37)-N6)-threonylcarbamoyltransferase complex dimerization subunit type 1 TsaB [Shimia aestuarii]